MSQRLRLGTAIANVFTRGPGLLAQEVTACAEAAPGRFCLGIGSSSPAIVENWNGVELKRPLERARETVATLRALLAGEKVTNETLRMRGFRLSRRFGGTPPIFIAALREKMLSLAGSAGDGVILNWLAPKDVPKAVAVAKRAAAEAGRDPDALEVACRIFVMPEADEGLANAVTRRVAAGYLSSPVYSAFHEWLGRGDALRPMLDAWNAGDRQAALQQIPEDVIQDLFVLGSRQECLDKVQAYVDAGVTVPVLAFLPTTVDPKEMGKRNIEVLRELGKR
jgi:probable F420-dependent oxidoreductase